MNKNKQKQRIKNQAEELAIEFCEKSGLENKCDILIKENTQTQTELNR